MSKVFTSQEDFEIDVRESVALFGYRCDDGREFCAWDLDYSDNEMTSSEDRVERATSACLEHIAKLQREGY